MPSRAEGRIVPLGLIEALSNDSLFSGAIALDEWRLSLWGRKVSFVVFALSDVKFVYRFAHLSVFNGSRRKILHTVH